MPEMPVLKYKKTWFDETCLEYLRDPEVCLNHKLKISLTNYTFSYGDNYSAGLFQKYLSDWFGKKITPLFSSIEIVGDEESNSVAFQMVPFIEQQKEQVFTRKGWYLGSHEFVYSTTDCPKFSSHSGKFNLVLFATPTNNLTLSPNRFSIRNQRIARESFQRGAGLCCRCRWELFIRKIRH